MALIPAWAGWRFWPGPAGEPVDGRRDRPAVANEVARRLALGKPVGLMLLIGVSATHAKAVTRPTVISINACTDQLLVTLADPDQILGVTRFARDPAQSSVVEEANRLPVVSGTAEEVLVAQPDIVLAGRFTKRATRDFLRRRGVRIVEYDAPRSLEDAEHQIAEVALLVGHPERGQAALRRVEASLAAARAGAAGRTGSVLPLQRRGWVPGEDTLVTSLIESIGFRNAGATFSSGFGRQVDLEQIIARRPDYLLVTTVGQAADQGSALLQHPALARLYPPEKRLRLPDRLIACGGPALARTVDALTAEAVKLPPASASALPDPPARR